MAKCRDCSKPNANYQHGDGSYICNDCVGSYFQCPSCGNVYDMNDYENGDQGNGFCINCASEN